MKISKCCGSEVYLEEVDRDLSTNQKITPHTVYWCQKCHNPCDTIEEVQNEEKGEEYIKPKLKSALMLGVNPNTIRQEEDFYATEPSSLVLFIEKLKEDGIELNKNVWECS
jgi:hypothetical protein